MGIFTPPPIRVKRPVKNLKCYTDLVKFFGGMGRGRNIFKGFLIYYCDSYRQPRIKHENPWKRFKFSECFLVFNFIYMTNVSSGVNRLLIPYGPKERRFKWFDAEKLLKVATVDNINKK